MIQELLGGERKISINGVLLESSTSPSPSPSPSSSENQNLRCPRCDSSNTKFCYYNNYNLTQPRYFCKTCRRYWTKGGALRNVPIGGGCRKNKSAAMPTPAAVKSCGGGRLKTVSSDQFPSNPIMWASPQNSHILALLRSTQNPNPDPNPNSILSSVAVKDEPGIMIGTHLGSESGVGPSGLNGRTPGLDPLSQFSSFWRNNFQEQAQQNQQNQLHNGFILGEVQNTNIQELYQRLRSSANYYADHSPQFLSNLNSSSSSSSSSSTSTILDSAPVGGSELGYWNSTLSWSHDLQTANGRAQSSLREAITHSLFLIGSSSVKVSKKVTLQGFQIPKRSVANGFLISNDPSKIVGGEPLGQDFCDVFVAYVSNRHEKLLRPFGDILTLGEAENEYIARPFVNVHEE